MRCIAGQAEKPLGCHWHEDHYFCGLCEGWYAALHSHEGVDQHPCCMTCAAACRCDACFDLLLSRNYHSSEDPHARNRAGRD